MGCHICPFAAVDGIIKYDDDDDDDDDDIEGFSRPKELQTWNQGH
jgi:hypothetical protein